MPRPTDPDANENAFRMSNEAIEAWLAEGETMKVSFRERVAEQKRRREEREVAA